MPVICLCCGNIGITIIQEDGKLTQEAHVILDITIRDDFGRISSLKVKPNTYTSTYASLLRKCSSAKNLAEGKLVHSSILKNGNGNTRFIKNLLVEMYGKCAAMQEARREFESILTRNIFSWNIIIGIYVYHQCFDEADRMFTRMQQEDAFPDKVTWTIMISSYAQNGNTKAAFQLFRDLLLKNSVPDMHTFLAILNACSSLESLADGRLIHACIIDFGLLKEVAIENALINMYGKCGGLESARMVFDKMLRRDLISWNSMIAIYAENGCIDKASEAFQHLQQEGLLPNIISWTTMITACSQSGSYNEVLQLFGQMQIQGIVPDKLTLVTMLGVFSTPSSLAKGRFLHCYIVVNELDLDLVLLNVIVSMYGKSGSIDDAIVVFCNMPQHDLVSWNTMIGAYAQNGHGKHAFWLFQQMQREWLMPNDLTFISVFDACLGTSMISELKLIHACVISNGIVSDMVGTSLIHLYGQIGNVENVQRIFCSIYEPNVVSWTSLLSVYLHNGCTVEVLEIFEQMEEYGVEPDRVTFVPIFDACRRLLAFALSKLLHARFIKTGFDLDDSLGSILVNAYAECQDLGNALDVFSTIPQQTVVSWTAMVAAYRHNGQGRDAIQLIRKMWTEDVIPDKITCFSILDVCADTSALLEGKLMHAYAINNGFTESVAMGVEVVNMYGKCGSVEDFVMVFERTVLHNLATWTAIITAYALNGYASKVLRLFDNMHQGGLSSNGTILASVLFVCGHAGLVDDGLHHFLTMTNDYCITPLHNHYGCMIDLVGRAGLLNEAEDLVCSIPYGHSSPLWETVLGACTVV